MVDQLVDLPPRNGNFRFILIESYSESSHVADLPPHKMAVINLYCESSYVTARIWQTSWQI